MAVTSSKGASSSAFIRRRVEAPIVRRVWKITLLVLLTLLVLSGAAFAWVIVYPPAFFPHERIVLALPYDANDTPATMIPMGETIYHPKPQVPHGHPGIDWNWEGSGEHALLAAADGVVATVKLGASEPGKVDITIRHGVYYTRYWELNDTNGLRVGDHVKVGDIVGHAGHNCDSQHCWSNVHWELASVSVVKDRWCPVTYFSPDARAKIEALWTSVPSTDKVKSQFPDICDGDYAGKAE